VRGGGKPWTLKSKKSFACLRLLSPVATPAIMSLPPPLKMGSAAAATRVVKPDKTSGEGGKKARRKT
jgi:hypothetical protein